MLDAEGSEVGKVTCGGFSPTLEAPIAMAYVADAAGRRRAPPSRSTQRGKICSRRRSSPMPFVPHRYHRKGAAANEPSITPRSMSGSGVEGDSATVGITDFAQGAAGRRRLRRGAGGRAAASAKGGEAAVVESVKAASDVYSPVGGEVIEGNQALVDDPALINQRSRKARAGSLKLRARRQSRRARRPDERRPVSAYCDSHLSDAGLRPQW